MIRRLRALRDRINMARPVGTLHPPRRAPLLIVAVLWLVCGVLWSPWLPVPRPAFKQLSWAGYLLAAGDAICRDNAGLGSVEPIAESRYTFHCRDGARFVDIRATFSEAAERRYVSAVINRRVIR
jgi:hypothetical protein